jgi:hypothetical protein
MVRDQDIDLSRLVNRNYLHVCRNCPWILCQTILRYSNPSVRQAVFLANHLKINHLSPTQSETNMITIVSYYNSTACLHTIETYFDTGLTDLELVSLSCPFTDEREVIDLYTEVCQDLRDDLLATGTSIRIEHLNKSIT